LGSYLLFNTLNPEFSSTSDENLLPRMRQENG